MALLLGLLQHCRACGSADKNRLVVWYREIKSLEMKYGGASNRPGPDAKWRDEIENIDAHASQIRILIVIFKTYTPKQAIASYGTGLPT